MIEVRNKPLIGIVDTSFFLRRSMYSKNTRDLMSEYGVPTGGVYSLLESVVYSCKEWSLDGIIFVFDCGHSTRRVQLYPEYKLRSPEGEEQRDQFGMTDYEYFCHQMKLLEGILSRMGIKMLKVMGKECDDIVYRVTRFMKDCDMLLLTEDKDYYCMIKDNVSVYRPIRQEYITNENIGDVTGYETPYKFFLGKVLCGDGSDNIPGCCKGVGESTYMKILDSFKGNPEKISAEMIVTRASELTNLRGKGKKLLENKEDFIKQYYINYNLINLELENFSLFDIQDLMAEIKKESSFNTLEVAEIFRKLSFSPNKASYIMSMLAPLGNFNLMKYVNNDYIKEYLGGQQ